MGSLRVGDLDLKAHVKLLPLLCLTSHSSSIYSTPATLASLLFP